MRRVALMCALAVAGCGGTQGARNDEAAARQLFDEALAARFDGDELGWRDKMLTLAAEHPKTRHGRRALLELNGGDALTMAFVFGLMAAMAVPAFERYQERSGETVPEGPVD
jgi:hypothetical protein